MKVHRPVGINIKSSSPYGPRIDPVTKKQGSFHYGYDFATPVGTLITSALAGRIDAVGFENPSDEKQGFGRRVRQIVTDGDKKFFIYYAHLSETSVQVGAEINAGSPIGLSGNTGKSSGPHLHFEVRPVGGKGIEVTFDA